MHLLLNFMFQGLPCLMWGWLTHIHIFLMALHYQKDCDTFWGLSLNLYPDTMFIQTHSKICKNYIYKHVTMKLTMTIECLCIFSMYLFYILQYVTSINVCLVFSRNFNRHSSITHHKTCASCVCIKNRRKQSYIIFI